LALKGSQDRFDQLQGRSQADRIDALTRTGQALDPHAPQLAASVRQVAASKEQYLLDHYPRNPVPPTGMGPPAPYKPSKAELARYGVIDRAVHQPLTLLEDFRQNRLSPDAVQAVKVTSPQIYQQIVGEVQQQLAELKKPLSYAKQTQASLLFGAPLSYNLKMFPRQQSQFNGQKTNGPQAPQRTRVTGLAKVKIADRAPGIGEVESE
jgi:hypothetical protein